MGDPRGFLKIKREAAVCRPVCERIKDYQEVSILRADIQSEQQASRCMDCGTPFCHWGCPVGNFIPEWNDFMFKGLWKEAVLLLHATNNFPEITGRLCPAPCETACVLGLNDEPVTCKENELDIIEYAFSKGWIKPNPPKKRTGKRIAVIGSGPAGLAAADELNKSGHKVTVFEKDDRIGGILRYGIPDFKLEKWILDRRLKILKKEGIEFKTNVNVGIDYSVKRLKQNFDAICLAIGCRTPRDLKIEGRNLKGIYFAMDYLTQANRINAGLKIHNEKIQMEGEKVVVMGGGDTGADCVGVAHREDASCVIQIELLPKPPECRTEDFPWPKYPMVLKTSTSHEEGAERKWNVLTKRFSGENGYVKKLHCVEVQFGPQKDARGCPIMSEMPGSEFEIEADLVILATGFTHPEKGALHASPSKGVFVCGDARRGSSLIVWAIYEGRNAAYHINKYLK